MRFNDSQNVFYFDYLFVSLCFSLISVEIGVKTSATLRRRHSFRFSQLELNRTQSKTNFDRLSRCCFAFVLCGMLLVHIRFSRHIQAMRCDGIGQWQRQPSVMHAVSNLCCGYEREKVFVNIVHWTGVRMRLCVCVSLCIFISICMAIATFKNVDE